MEQSQGEEVKKKPLTYSDIIQRLVARFIHQTKKDMKMDGVNEDDLLEIKQDISSLRYELRDDRRREIVRSSSHIDAVKRDIMRTMSSTRSRAFGGKQGFSPRRTSVAEEQELTSTDEDEERKDCVSLVLTPLSNTIHPEVFHDDMKKEIGQRSFESGNMDLSERPRLIGSHRCSDSAHMSLCKTDSSFSYPINGIMIRSTPPKSVLKSPESPRYVGDTTSLEAILNLKNELNQKLDLLISSISNKTERKEPSPNLTPTTKLNGKVNFSDRSEVP
ncbi:hypothetical protein KIN20_012183 [Parelaphostrongylus tenuis]|uniref:Uncharacterized protein n=1 Tax=Parelaphostrongylus tenuis TaxID=148309 RepID=A0AAD5MT60_PARTN|nr:hypothetical protein KIN20_012183 [Parelaphostrongylus tenuis]